MDDNTPHFGSDDRATARWRWFLRRTVLIPLVALIAVGVGVWVLVQVNKTSDNKTTDLQSVIQKSNDAYASGDYQASFNTLKGASDQAKTDTEKVKLYSDLASAATSAGKLTDAIDYLNKKHDIDPSTKGQDAYQMGTLYERLGQKDNAIAQYNLAIDYLRSQAKTPSSQSDIQSLQIRIQSLKG